MLQNGLETRGFVPSKIDPCLFIRNNCVIITYVNDCLILHKNKKVLEDLIKSLKGEFNLTDKGDVDVELPSSPHGHRHPRPRAARRADETSS